MAERASEELKNRLLWKGCFLPHASLREPKLAGKAEASFSARFSGIGAWEKDPDVNLRERIWQQCRGMTTDLSLAPCNWFFADAGALESLAVHLVSETGGKASVCLRKVEQLWEYGRDPGGVVWRTEVAVPAGCDDLLRLSTDGLILEAGCYRLEVEGDKTIAWRMSGRHPWGVVGGHTVGSGRYHWNRVPGEYAFQVSPALNIYSADQVLSGGHRPQAQSNVWFADGALPQWVGVQWEAPRSLDEVAVTFPDQLMMELHCENPFYVAPYIAKRYKLLARVNGEWKTVAEETENVQSRRVHSLGGIQADGLSVLVEETHGGRAAVCSIRVS